MRVTLRLVAATWIFAFVVLGAFTWVHVRQERQRLVDDLALRATIVGEGVKQAVEPAARRAAPRAVARILRKLAQPERTIVVFDQLGSPVAAAPTEIARSLPDLPEVAAAIAGGTATQGLRRIDGRQRYAYATLLTSDDDKVIGAVAAILDASPLDAALAGAWRYNALRFLVLAIGLSILTFLIVGMARRLRGRKDIGVGYGCREKWQSRGGHVCAVQDGGGRRHRAGHLSGSVRAGSSGVRGGPARKRAGHCREERRVSGNWRRIPGSERLRYNQFL